MSAIIDHRSEVRSHRQKLITRAEPTSNGVLGRVLFAVAVVLGLSFAGFQAYKWWENPEALPVRVVELRGQLQYVNQADLREHVQAEVSGGFFNLDIQRIKRSLEALPWVYEVSLRRVWPDQLNIRVQEQRPIAYWGNDGLLNQYGEIFRPDLTGLTLSLPYFYGEESQREAMITHFVNADKLLHPLELVLVSLKMDQRNELRLLLSNGIELALGRQQQLERLGGFTEAYAESVAPFVDRIEALDLRYPNGFAVKWKEGVRQLPHEATSEGKG